ncbi:hypothetical protein [Candidatus Cytomitobacter primus]|uniref:hypothetical protein n=1 Tax=Candidatus Cytomitobacter primus TaxID=2066024 RepID=UPI0024E1C9F0|nr:hypothetical protein [Candidatus Cytomitobacter primus]
MKNNMMLLRSLILVVGISIDAAPISSEMHVFDVGQGNCQLNTYVVQNPMRPNGEERIGFLYDCGSCEFPQRLGGKGVLPGGILNSDKLIHSINDKLVDLDLLVIVLSHPDLDHINKIDVVLKSTDIKAKIDNDTLKIISFLCGDFVGKNTVESWNVQEVLSKYAIEPFYWDKEKSSNFFSGNILRLWDKAKSQLENKVKNRNNHIYAAIDDVIEKIKEEEKNIEIAVREAKEAAEEKTSKAIEAEKKAIREAKEAAEKKTSKAIEAEKKAIREAKEAAEKKTSKAIEAEEKKIRKAIEEGEKETSKAIEAEKKAIREAKEAAEKKTSKAIEAEKKAIREAKEAAEKKTSKAIEAEKKAIREAKEAAEKKTSKAIEAEEKKIRKAIEEGEKETSKAIEEGEKEIREAKEAEKKVGELEKYDGCLDLFDNAVAQLKDYIYIWSMNTAPGNDQNAVSPIISFTHTVPGTKYLSMICTGDAEDSTVCGKGENSVSSEGGLPLYLKDRKDIVRRNMKLQKYSYVNALMQATDSHKVGLYALYDSITSDTSDHDIICVAPHHGSAGQANTVLLLNDLMKMSMVYVSNGHGGRHPHINKRWYRTMSIGIFNNDIIKRYNYLCINSKDAMGLSVYDSSGDKIKLKGSYDIYDKEISITMYSEKKSASDSYNESAEHKHCQSWLYSTNNHGSLHIYIRDWRGLTHASSPSPPSSRVPVALHNSTGRAGSVPSAVRDDNQSGQSS